MAVATEVTLLGNAGDPVEYTIADTAFPKGTLMYLSANNTMAASTTNGQFFVGVLCAEKVSGDGKVKASVWTHGIFIMTGSATTASAGNTVMLDGANTVGKADEDTIAKRGEIVGLALEDIGSGGTGEVLINL